MGQGSSQAGVKGPATRALCVQAGQTRGAESVDRGRSGGPGGADVAAGREGRPARFYVGRSRCVSAGIQLPSSGPATAECLGQADARDVAGVSSSCNVIGFFVAVPRGKTHTLLPSAATVGP